jgi:hypothetical protein
VVSGCNFAGEIGNGLSNPTQSRSSCSYNSTYTIPDAATRVGGAALRVAAGYRVTLATFATPSSGDVLYGWGAGSSGILNSVANKLLPTILIAPTGANITDLQIAKNGDFFTSAYLIASTCSWQFNFCRSTIF